MLAEIENEMERKAIANSIIEQKIPSSKKEEELKEVIQEDVIPQQQPDVNMWAESSLVDSVLVEEDRIEEEKKGREEHIVQDSLVIDPFNYAKRVNEDE